MNLIQTSSLGKQNKEKNWTQSKQKAIIKIMEKSMKLNDLKNNRVNQWNFEKINKIDKLLDI